MSTFSFCLIFEKVLRENVRGENWVFSLTSYPVKFKVDLTSVKMGRRNKKISNNHREQASKALKRRKNPQKTLPKNNVRLRVEQANKGAGMHPENRQSRCERLTYLMFDGQYYKIGQAVDPESRRVSLETSPSVNIKIIATTDRIEEKILHRIFKKFQVRHPHLREWFRFTDLEKNFCMSLMKGTADPETAHKLAYMNKKSFKQYLQENSPISNQRDGDIMDLFK
jgi:hypothetical protein